MLQRIKQYIDYKNIPISVFEKSIGMSNASFGKSLKTGGSIGCDKLEKILKIYTDLNIEWLVTGIGEMLSTSKPTVMKDQQKDLLITLLREKDLRIEELNKEIGKLKEQNNSLKKYSLNNPQIDKAAES